MQTFEAHFQLLELEQTASLEEVRQAYRDLVMVWHPDRFGHNLRLRQKAEVKLKQVNQAYEHLKQWYSNPGQAKKPPSSPSAKPYAPKRPPQKTQKTDQQQARRKSQSSPPPPRTKTTTPNITQAHAEYILKQYCFKTLPTSNSAHQDYQSGPFILVVSPSPLTVTLSVPCSSLQGFDRILLSIPCKSVGHFYEAQAQALLQLLQTA